MKQVIKEKWNDILEYMKKEYNISDVSFKTWLKDLTFYDLEENIITIIIKDNLLGDNAIDFIRNKYGLFIKTAIAEITNEDYEIQFVRQSYITELEEKEKDEKTENKVSRVNYLNTKYTFDNFVVGDNNNAAQAACLAVAESPGKVFNPLFIYGGPGLGKTHLMYAITNFLMEHRPDLKVLYTSSEKFTTDLIESIKSGYNAPEEFRQKYRTNDVLLIDDVQFIIGKERTQEEFFHTFNEMKDSGRQIIISSDKPPREMKILDERFRSRFEWGLTVDIQPPAFETRVAILNKKMNQDNLKLDDKIITYIAENIKSNIRELEGALTKVVAMGRLQKREINLELAQEALKDMISPDEKKTITPALVLDIVAEHYDLTPAMICGKTKSRNIAYPRQIAMYLCRTLITSMSLSEIGAAMGNRDHTTILHGCNKIDSDLKTDDALKNTIDILIKKINPQ
ncbi:MAG: chromosomal replication initiator protein DnaA [Lachnospiraceae bacterium]